MTSSKLHKVKLHWVTLNWMFLFFILSVGICWIQWYQHVCHGNRAITVLYTLHWKQTTETSTTDSEWSWSHPWQGNGSSIRRLVFILSYHGVSSPADLLLLCSTMYNSLQGAGAQIGQSSQKHRGEPLLFSISALGSFRCNTQHTRPTA